jgi:predicted permease
VVLLAVFLWTIAGFLLRRKRVVPRHRFHPRNPRLFYSDRR